MSSGLHWKKVSDSNRSSAAAAKVKGLEQSYNVTDTSANRYYSYPTGYNL